MLVTSSSLIAKHKPVKVTGYTTTYTIAQVDSVNDICIGLTTQEIPSNTIIRNGVIKTGILHYIDLSAFSTGDSIYSGVGDLTNISNGQFVGTVLSSTKLDVHIVNNNFKPIVYDAFVGNGTTSHTINAKATLSSLIINLSGLTVLPGNYSAIHSGNTTVITLSGNYKFNTNQPCVIYYQAY